MTEKQAFAVPPVPPLLYALLAAIWLAITTVAILRTQAGAWQADPVPWWIVPPFAAALVVVGPLIWILRRQISIDGGALVVAAGINTRTVPIADLALDEARILDLDEHTDFKPLFKLFGGGVPGYRTGHFLLRNRRRAFLLLTRNDRALLLPQRDGPYLLLSLEKPQALLDALRSPQP